MDRSLNQKVVLWFYFEDNDLHDLKCGKKGSFPFILFNERNLCVIVGVIPSLPRLCGLRHQLSLHNLSLMFS